MNNATPTLSIVIPVYNRTDHLKACVESTFRQTYKNIEILLVDDQSDEETRRHLYIFSTRDSRVRVLLNTGIKGANACRNLGLRESRGEFVIFLDSDDVLCPFCAELRIKDMRAAPGLDFIAYPCLMFMKRPLDRLIIWNVPDHRPLLERFLRQDIPFQTAGPIWRRASLQNVVSWDEHLPGWQDWKFHVQALLAGLKGDLRTRIDFYWNAPKPDSITRKSHDKAGRLQRIKMLVDLAEEAPARHRFEILSSVVSLSLRMAREGRIASAMIARKALRNHPAAFHTFAFILLERLHFIPLVYIRGYFRKKVFEQYPLVGAILKECNTYKLVASEEQLNQLVALLPNSKRRRRILELQKALPSSAPATLAA